MPILPPDNTPAPTAKSGVQTSEFWMSALAQIVALVSQYAGAIPPPWGVVASVALTAIYTIARAFVKANVPATSTTVTATATATP